MEAKKSKMCKVRLRRLRPDMTDKIKIKRGISKADTQFTSSSSETEDDEMEKEDECEKISIKLRSPLALGSNKDFDPYILLTEAQAALKLCTDEEKYSSLGEEKRESVQMGESGSKTVATAAGTNKKPKHCKKEKSKYYPMEECSGGNSRSKLRSFVENDIYDLIYYHSDDEGPCSYNCNHGKLSSTAPALAPTDCRNSSTGGSFSPLSEKCSMRFSKLFEDKCISVMDDENPSTALSKILSIKEFDPLAPQQILTIVIIKSTVSLAELSQRDDNVVCIDIDKRRILEFSAMSPEEKRKCPLNPYMDVSNIIVTHSEDEFITFCLCENCEKYREFVMYIMVEQFKSTNMVVMLLDVLIKSYGPMLKNITAYNKFEKLLDSNKEIYWITCGVIYHKKAEHLDFIYDEYISDNMIFVLFSSILMLNNPLLLLQILAFHIECIVKAYAEGFLEIVERDKNKIPADEMINYILNGYDDLVRISEQVASYLFAFENNFLRKFSLTWKLLCQRLYQQHVHLHLEDTMLACIITLKEEELTSHHTDLIKRYIQFDDIMNYVEKRWTDVWIELNKFNLSEVERKRRKSLLDVYRIFDTLIQDAIGFSLQDSVDDNDFYDFRFLKNRRLAWKNIMLYTKRKWPDGFFEPPNTLVVDDKCSTCNVSLEYHVDCCKCITCSIAGSPLPPRRNSDGKCSKCLAHEIVEKEVNFYDSKILNVCASDDFQNLVAKSIKNDAKCKNTALLNAEQDLCSTLASIEDTINASDYDIKPQRPTSSNSSYHISWAVFSHLNNRKRFPHPTIEEKFFCSDCKLPSCLLACKILNNKISPSLSHDLVHYYQPLPMSREELRSILPNITIYNRKLVASNNGLDLIDVHDLVVKIYWIFIISIYALYLTDFEDKDSLKTEADKNNCATDPNQEKYLPLNLDALELANNDIQVNVEKITGNKDDTKFLEFLDKLKSLSPYTNDEESNIPLSCDHVSPLISTPMEDDEQFQSSELPLPNTFDARPKKTCKEKTKKCCFDHSDMDENYKENHSSKKRLKKDCNHARMNETRDRLRKKLSQIVNARKNTTPIQIPQAPQTSTSTSLTSNNSESQNPMELILNTDGFERFQRLKQPEPHSWDDVQEMVHSFEQIHTEVTRNKKLKNVSDCLQYLQTNSKSETKSSNNSDNKKVQQIHQKKLEKQHMNEPPNKKINFSDNSVVQSSISNHAVKNNTDGGSTTISNSSKKSESDLNFVSEICEIIDSYSKEQAKRSSNENLNNLCECLQQLKTNSKSDAKTDNNKNSKHIQQNHYQQQQKLQVQQQYQNDIQIQPTCQLKSSVEPQNKKSSFSNNSTRDASTSSQSTKCKDKDNNTTNINASLSASKATNNLDFVSEICEIIDNYSKEQAKRRWIKETLSFIEGPSTSAGKKKTQPQTLNPKKAAKKAKQKQRKEEEKRIAELQDQRAQFHSIYFKEFSEKFNLKSMKANKKRDKKKISELENNIKNLQRAKAKVETAILELIATVKQTNSEFRFSYLPTKEQQMEKLRELEGYDSNVVIDKTIKVRNLLHQPTKDSSVVTPPLSSPFSMSTKNNLNMVPESYSMPYAHANQFPYNLSFQPPAAPSAFGLMRPTPMCYSPPHLTTISSKEEQRSLTPDGVATISSNANSNSSTDPSKRIVTIRRVNLPNVPEPRVTVTAKGSSPDKDKLLYTFINGQLVETGAASPINIPQMPAIAPLNNQQIQSKTSETNSHTLATKLSVENLLAIPPPPLIKLSKTQIKKERKRLAKLQAEEKMASEFERNQIQPDQKEQNQSNQNKKQQKKTKKSSKTSKQEVQLSCYANNKELISKKHKLSISNSTTSISTNETNESPKLPQMLALKNSEKQKRSISTTTSCSAATLSSSNNSTSSQMATRDNSVSSLKPVDSKALISKRNDGIKEQKCNANLKSTTNNKNKTKSNQQKFNKKQNRTPLTPSTTSSDGEDAEEKDERENKENKTLSVPPSKTNTLQKLTKPSKANKQKTLASKVKPIQKSITPSSSDTDSDEEVEQINNIPIKESKKRRPKFVDNGQFDNNPFKSLHMQDSETDWSSDEDLKIEEESGNEVGSKKIDTLNNENIIQKDARKVKYKEENKSNKPTQIKKHKYDFKENNTQTSSKPLTGGNYKNIVHKTSKNNNSAKFQEQNDGSEQQTPINVNKTKSQNKPHDSEKKGNNQAHLPNQNTQQSFGRKTKSDNRQTNSINLGSHSKSNNKQQNNFSNQRSQNRSISGQTLVKFSNINNNISQSGNNNRHSQNNQNTNGSINVITEQKQHSPQNDQQLSSHSNTEKRNQTTKRSQRKKFQQKTQKHSSNMHQQNCCTSSGIPNHMGYFNINDVNIAPSQTHQVLTNNNNNNNSAIESSSYQSLEEQMQTLRLSSHQIQANTATSTAQLRQQHINSANVSIMDQLNRGVQVENLSLPPGITLTKVDPIKSEQLRQKSESIKKLAKPLTPQSNHSLQQAHLTQSSQAFRHSSVANPTIIAPPVVSAMSNYYGSPYVTASGAIDPQGGIIMVEANPTKTSVINSNKIQQPTGTCNNKQSKNKKRRNKSKANNLSSCVKPNSDNSEAFNSDSITCNSKPNMITLRNPMFHGGPAAAAAAMLQTPVLLPGRTVEGLPMPTPLSVDQPAAIIKNENGMYTIRNPALHQAVTSGLAMGGYRQFGGNVNYYTPQEAAAEAARATRQQQQRSENSKSSIICGNSTSSFSYFSNDAIQTNTPHNNISISCTSISGTEINEHSRTSGSNVGGLTGEAAVIQRPTPQQRPISAIGSEIKNAQQQKQKSKIEQQQWTNFGSETMPLNKNDNLNTSFLNTVTECASSASGGGGDLNLQEKYQQSKYYNGFDVFTSSSGGSNSSAATCGHLHHSCGDDSPPPSITGYNSYLEGIPNTGVIHYDDAAFLKNLIPGQNLNNEVSIHNVNESNFTRNAKSPTAHHVEITPVYGNRPPSTSLYESSAVQANQTNYRGNYSEPLNDYKNESTIFPTNNVHLNINELETSMKYDFDPTASTSSATVAGDASHNTILDLNDLLIQNGPTDQASHRTSPYLNEEGLEGFVKNINSLQISTTSTEEQSSHLNGSTPCAGQGSTTNNSANSSNGWW